jgi:hypothetical protein
MNELVLEGLDGKNPLAFLAALGVLGAAADAADAADAAETSADEPQLRWELRGTYRPVLVGGPDRAGLIGLLRRDLETFRREPAIEGLRYAKPGGAEAHDLKPPPGWFATYLQKLIRDVPPRDASGHTTTPEHGRRSLDLAAAFATDVAQDNNGNTKPTALHFTAGQQELLAMVSELIQGVTDRDLEEALFGPWRYDRPLPVLQWDNAASRDYALRASDPSKEKKLGVPGADWLAFRGLPFMRVAPREETILTTGCRGGWKTGVFRWPLWEVALPRRVVMSLLASPEVLEARPGTLRARGISMVFDSDIRRSDQGGYGSFTPARVADPIREP